jgi:hypothetical protein
MSFPESCNSVAFKSSLIIASPGFSLPVPAKFHLIVLTKLSKIAIIESELLNFLIEYANKNKRVNQQH